MKVIEMFTDKGASQEEIQKFEQELNCTLPEEYVDFLMKYNGGGVDPDSANFIFSNKNKQEDSLVDWFYTLTPDEDYNIQNNMDIFSDRIPKGVLTIGCDPFGNQILIGTTKHHGEIFFWDHEEENYDDDEDPTWDNISKISSSFSEFFNLNN